MSKICFQEYIMLCHSKDWAAEFNRDSWRKTCNFTETNEILHGLNEPAAHIGTWFTIQHCIFWHFPLVLELWHCSNLHTENNNNNLKNDIILRKTACFLLHIPFTFIECVFSDRKV